MTTMVPLRARIAASWIWDVLTPLIEMMSEDRLRMETYHPHTARGGLEHEARPVYDDMMDDCSGFAQIIQEYDAAMQDFVEVMPDVPWGFAIMPVMPKLGSVLSSFRSRLFALRKTLSREFDVPVVPVRGIDITGVR